MKDKKKFRPFSNIIEMILWLDINCDRCKKRHPKTSFTKRTACKGEYHIQLAAMEHGNMPKEIAKWIGIHSNGYTLKNKCNHFRAKKNTNADDRTLMTNMEYCELERLVMVKNAK